MALTGRNSPHCQYAVANIWTTTLFCAYWNQKWTKSSLRQFRPICREESYFVTSFFPNQIGAMSGSVEARATRMGLRYYSVGSADWPFHSRFRACFVNNSGWKHLWSDLSMCQRLATLDRAARRPKLRYYAPLSQLSSPVSKQGISNFMRYHIEIKPVTNIVSVWNSRFENVLESKPLGWVSIR